MKNKILLCTQLNRDKVYTLHFVRDTIKRIEGIADVHILIENDGEIDIAKFKESIPETWTVGLIDFKTVHVENEIRAAKLGHIREAQRKYFAAGKWTHLYYHDSDMIVPDGATHIQRLLDLQSPIAAHAYCLRSAEFPIFVVLDADIEETMQGRWGGRVLRGINGTGIGTVRGCGMGAMLIARKVAEQVAFTTDYVGMDVSWYGEDFDYCIRAKEQCDANVVVRFDTEIWHASENGYSAKIVLGPEEAQIMNLQSYPVVNKFGTWQPGVWTKSSPAIEEQMRIGFTSRVGRALTMEVEETKSLCARYGLSS